MNELTEMELLVGLSRDMKHLGEGFAEFKEAHIVAYDKLDGRISPLETFKSNLVGGIQVVAILFTLAGGYIIIT